MDGQNKCDLHPEKSGSEANRAEYAHTQASRAGSACSDTM
jgi:hypothetical protein